MVQEGDGKQQQIENLSGGEHSDNDPSVQPENTYRHGLNGNLVTRDGRNYSYESQNGTIIYFQLPQHKYLSTEVFIPTAFIPLGTSILVLSTNENAGEIGLLNNIENRDSDIEYKALYYHTELGFSKEHQVGTECYGICENDSIWRAYWTDNNKQPRTFNAKNEILWTDINTGDTLVAGEKYMVITDTYGSITYNTVVYGPLQTAGNIFVCDGVHMTFTINNGTPRVIKYINPLIFDYTPQKTVGTIIFKEWAYNGHVMCGNKYYAYRLSTKDGYQSGWTFLTNPISVTASNGSAQGLSTAYEGASGSTNSGKSISLTIDSIETSLFDTIQVAVIEVDSTYEVITNSVIFWNTNINGETMTITHYGNENLETIIFSDLIIKNSTIIKAKSMSTTKQRQMLHHITQQGIIVDKQEITADAFIYKFPADDTEYPNTNYYINQVSNSKTGVLSGQIRVNGIYVVRSTDPTGSYIDYAGTYYYDGDTFIGGYDTSYSYQGFSNYVTVKACIRHQLYTKYGSGDPVYKIIELNNEFWGYKSMAFEQNLKGYWRSTDEINNPEIYRFGYLYFDLFGNPMAVQFAVDVTTPHQSKGSSNEWSLLDHAETDNTATYPRYTSIKALGIRFSNLDITSIKDKIGGIAIVRVPRDGTIMGQGLIMQNIYAGVEDNGQTRRVPISMPEISQDGWWNTLESHTTPYIWGWMSPEYDFDASPFQTNLISGDKFIPVADYEALESHYGGSTQKFDCLVGPSKIEQCIYSKYYRHNKFTPSNTDYNPLIEDVQQYVAGGEGTINYGDRSQYFLNADIYSEGPAAPSSGSTVGPAGATGDRRMIIAASKEYLNGSNSDKSTGTDGVSTSRRLIANIIRPKSASSLYGGTSDAAKANNRYMMTGHYLKITPELLADIEDATDPTNKRYVINGMDVWGGDCYVNLYDRVNSLWNDDDYTGAPYTKTYSWGLVFPCESGVNIALRSGLRFSYNTLANLTGIFWKNTGTFAHPEQFIYNPAYSSENKLIKYDSVPYQYRNINRFPFMSRWSEVKKLGEPFDNMRIFLLNNFKNVDATHGELTKGIVLKDYLFALQEHGVSYLPIDERELISSPIAGATQLGVGGVMERADTKDMFYGTQHKHSVFIAEKSIVFFDWNRLALCVININGETIDMSVVKGKQSYFYALKETIDNITYAIMPTSDNPLSGTGILGYYDSKFKVAFMTFVWTGFNGEINKWETNGITVAIANTLDKFIGDFSFTPGIISTYLNRTIGIRSFPDSINLYPATQYDFRDIIFKNGVAYVCYNAFTSGDPINANEEPDYPNSIYWLSLGSASQIHHFWKGDICKFFGLVYPYELTKVFGSNSIQDDKAFDVIEAYGNNTPFTDVYHQTSELSSSDINITAKNKNFGYVNNAWWFNVALANGKQRLVDRYLITKVVVKNYLTNPTSSLNKIKRIVYLQIINRKKE